MPVKLNIGLSRKVGEVDGGAREASLHLELEVEPGLLAETPRLHKRIRQLFYLLRAALAEELDRRGCDEGGVPIDEAPAATTGPKSAPGKPQGGVRPATPAQVKAIYAVARQQGVNVAELLRERYGVGRPEALTIRQASELIDQLKSSGGGPPT